MFTFKSMKPCLVLGISAVFGAQPATDLTQAQQRAQRWRTDATFEHEGLRAAGPRGDATAKLTESQRRFNERKVNFFEDNLKEETMLFTTSKPLDDDDVVVSRAIKFDSPRTGHRSVYKITWYDFEPLDVELTVSDENGKRISEDCKTWKTPRKDGNRYILCDWIKSEISNNDIRDALNFYRGDGETTQSARNTSNKSKCTIHLIVGDSVTKIPLPQKYERGYSSLCPYQTREMYNKYVIVWVGNVPAQVTRRATNGGALESFTVTYWKDEAYRLEPNAVIPHLNMAF